MQNYAVSKEMQSRKGGGGSACKNLFLGKFLDDWNLRFAELRSHVGWEVTFDLRKRRFPKPTNPSRNLKIYIQVIGLKMKNFTNLSFTHILYPIFYVLLFTFVYFRRNKFCKALFSNKKIIFWPRLEISCGYLLDVLGISCGYIMNF